MVRTYGWKKILGLVGTCLLLCLWLIAQHARRVEIDSRYNRTFRQEVLQSDAPVLLLFCADWHWSGIRKKPPVVPAVKEIVRKYKGVIKFNKIEVNSRNNPMAKKFEIKWIPIVLIFKNGRVVWRGEGGGCTKAESIKAMEKELKRIF